MNNKSKKTAKRKSESAKGKSGKSRLIDDSGILRVHAHTEIRMLDLRIYF